MCSDEQDVQNACPVPNCPAVDSAVFVVFGTAIGSRMQAIVNVEYGSFIVRGLIMLTVLLQSTSNASFGSIPEIYRHHIERYLRLYPIDAVAMSGRQPQNR